MDYINLKIVSIRWEYLKPTARKLFLLRIVVRKLIIYIGLLLVETIKLIEILETEAVFDIFVFYRNI